MNTLGSLSQIYMFILLILLFVGSGLALWGFINFLIKKTAATGTGNEGQNKDNKTATILSSQPINNKKTNGGYFMNNNGWIKLAVFSFVGIIISVIILGFISTSGNQGLSSQHNQMQNSSTGTMQMQNNNSGMTNDQMMMQQQLTQMQQQLSQMQQQMGMMQTNTGASMSSGATMPQSGGSGMMMDSMMTMMGGMMDMMGSMQQSSGSMSNMPATTPAPAMAPMAPAAPAAPAMAPMPMM